MKIFITGASGFIGKELGRLLLDSGHQLYAVGRNKQGISDAIKFLETDYRDFSGMKKHLDEPYTVINLAGENIAGKKWSEKQKEKIYNSRVELGKKLSSFLLEQEVKPISFLQASAIGFYENEKDVLCDEYAPGTTKFLSRVAQDTELSVIRMKEYSRIIFLRTGMVLSARGGALPKMALPFRLFAGGKIGSGRQNMSWIHLEDEVRAIAYLATSKVAKGIYNLTSPLPVTHEDFSKTLAKVLRRPYYLHIPEKAISILFGEMGQEVLLKGPKVIPKRLTDLGFEFNYRELYDALTNIFQKK